VGNYFNIGYQCNDEVVFLEKLVLYENETTVAVNVSRSRNTVNTQ
jgi:hypothetical protein